MFEFQK